MTVDQYKYKVLNNFFDILHNEGYVDPCVAGKIMILEILNEYVNGSFSSCTIPEYHKIVLPILYELAGSDCVFELPECEDC